MSYHIMIRESCGRRFHDKPHILNANSCQAACEAVTALPAVLCGTNLIHDIGYLESGMTGSFEMIAIGNEIADICFRIARGVTVDDETLATDIVANVGPGGQFLAQKHHRLIRQLEKKLEREQISLGRDLLSTDRL